MSFSGYHPGGPSKILDVQVRGCSKVELTWHAQEQMRTRGISEADILRTLERATEELPVNVPNRKKIRWNKTVRFSIDVVYVVIGDHLVVITAIKNQRRIARRQGK